MYDIGSRGLSKRNLLRVLVSSLTALAMTLTIFPMQIDEADAEERVSRTLRLPNTFSELETCRDYYGDTERDGYFIYSNSIDARQRVRSPITVNLDLMFDQSCSSDPARYERTLTLTSGDFTDTVSLGYNPIRFEDEPYWDYPASCGQFMSHCYFFDETVPINFTVDYSKPYKTSKSWDLTFDVKYIDEVCRYEGDFLDPNRVRVCEDKQISLSHTFENFIVTEPLSPAEFKDLYGYDPRPAEPEPSTESDADSEEPENSDDPVVVDENKSSEQVLNAGSFKGYVALYVKGYGGARFSAKVGNDWVIVPIVGSSFERYVEFTGAGYEINVRMYINRELITTKTITTK